jgi:hypothetical protein
MPQAVDSIALALEQLSDQVRHLESRVAALEAQPASSPLEVQPASVTLERPRPPATWRGFPPVETPSGVIPILGKAVLGMAGAYLLRALAESSTIPKLPVLFVATLYACFWLVWAVRVHAVSRFASATYAITSAMILSPLLWESTVRFQVLSPVIAAAVTVGFVMLAIGLAWRRDLQLIPWVATLASVAVALALIIETHELVPLTAALLAVALVTEATACLGHRLTLRAIPALAADFAVWLLVFILASETIPEGYHSAAPGTIVVLCFLLVAIYGASIGVRGFIMRHPITIFEMAQGVLALVLASYGMMRATQGSVARSLGGMLLLFSAVCYWGALWRFTDDSQTRNRRICAAWAAALLLAGSFLFFPANFQVPLFSLVAIATTLLYIRTHKISLGIHASFYLAAAVSVSTLPAYATKALTRNVPGLPGWPLSVIIVAAAISYGLGSRDHPEENRNRRVLWLIPAAIVGFTAAALVVTAIAHIASTPTPLGASGLSMIRTGVVCAVALAFGILGSHGKRAELGWLAYAAVALGTLKLFLEDLRFGNATSMVVSLLFYGSILIFLPRLTKHRGAD